MKTDRTILKNKPDIIIYGNEKKNVYINRCCNFRDRNVIKREAEAILKYEDLTTEI